MAAPAANGMADTWVVLPDEGAAAAALAAYAEQTFAALAADYDLNGVTPGNATNLVLAAMAAVEGRRGLTGPQKKALVTAVVERLLDEIPGAESELASLKTAVRLLLPAVIDSAAAAARGLFGINSPAAGQPAANCARRFLPCCFGGDDAGPAAAPAPQ